MFAAISHLILYRFITRGVVLLVAIGVLDVRGLLHLRSPGRFWTAPPS
jgi:hypothetical protein